MDSFTLTNSINTTSDEDSNILSQKLIAQFFYSLSMKKLDESDQVLAQLRALSIKQPELLSWAAYLTGVLVFERDNDWAHAERVFTKLLQSELEPHLRGRILIALGRTLDIQGRWPEAIDVYKRSLPVFKKLEQPIEQVKALKNIAISSRRAYEEGDSSEESLQVALDSCQLALDILLREGKIGKDSLWLKGSLYNTLGLIYMELNQWDKSIAYFEEDIRICHILSDHFGLSISYSNLGEVYQKQGENYWPDAEKAYKLALDLAGPFSNPNEKARTLKELASLYKEQGKNEEAMACYKQAVELIENVRTSISSEDARVSFFTTVVDVYAQTVQILVEQNRIGDAFDMVERARARSFMELLAPHTIRPSQNIPKELISRERILREQLRELYDSPLESNERITKLEQELNIVIQELRLIDSEYIDLRTVQPLGHTQIQRRLPLDTAILAYFIIDERVLAFVITQGSLTVHQIPITLESLQAAFDTNGYVLRLVPDSMGHLHRPWILSRLYESLIEPVSERLKGKSTLCILPYGVLHQVPFQALTYIDKSKHLHSFLDDYRILYAPSATILLEHNQKKNFQDRKSILAIGFNGETLQHSEAEAIDITGLVEDGTALVGPQATVSSALHRTQDVQWLHLACHANFNPSNPLTSHLLLADGPLYATDILRNLHLQADLVTLSACDTGRSQILKGDEHLGLVRAFMYAGTPSVLVSLWPVDEISTRILMERFYQELINGRRKVEALKLAQKYLRDLSSQQIVYILAAYGEPNPSEYVRKISALTGNDCTYSHPYFWASFILIGDQL